MINIKQGDCLELMKEIPTGSVDLILCDPPYGTIKGAPLDGWKNQTTNWDEKIPTLKLFNEISRVLRQNGKCVLFAQEPYTSELISNSKENLTFSYRAVWIKNNHANPLMAKKAMVNRYEDICIFQKNYDFENLNPLRNYFEKVMQFANKTKKEIIDELGQGADHCFRIKSTQFALCTENVYKKIIDNYGIEQMNGFKTYEELTAENERYTSTFNLWEQNKSKSNVLKYSKDNEKYHPTQKPVKLLEDLIKTFTNENDTVLDFAMGSGSTGVACQNTNRNFIGYELDDKYFDIAKERLGL